MADDEDLGERCFRWDMGFDFAELARLAPGLPGGDRLVRSDRRLAATLPDGSAWSLDVGPEGRRTIALLALPVTPVTLRLVGFDASRADAFLARFFRVYQKGGG